MSNLHEQKHSMSNRPSRLIDDLYDHNTLAASQQKWQEDNTGSEPKGGDKKFIFCPPRDFYTLLFGTSMVISTIVGVIDFLRTGNTSMLLALCYLAASHTGVQKLHKLIRGK